MARGADARWPSPSLHDAALECEDRLCACTCNCARLSLYTLQYSDKDQRPQLSGFRASAALLWEWRRHWSWSMTQDFAFCRCVQVISTARTCNLILVVLDCLKPISHKKLIEHELEGFGIRLNRQPPGITFRRKEKGGLSFTTTISNPRLDLDSEPTRQACQC